MKQRYPKHAKRDTDKFKFVESTERKHYMFYIYIIFDFAMAVIMLLFGIWFYRSKGQASNFLSGYNMKSAEERKNMMKMLCVRHMGRE